LTGLRDQFKAGLSAAAHEAGEGKEPSVPELASRIKALKAANTIEAARIRRRQGTNAGAAESVQADGVLGAGETLPPPAARRKVGADVPGTHHD
jgi:hypothetical protein